MKENTVNVIDIMFKKVLNINIVVLKTLFFIYETMFGGHQKKYGHRTFWLLQ